MPTQTIFVTQSFPVGHTVWPNDNGQNVPNNLTLATITLTGTTTIPAGATASVGFHLTYDNGASWLRAGDMFLPGGVIASGNSVTVPFEGADRYKVTVDVSGAAVTLGAQVTTG